MSRTLHSPYAVDCFSDLLTWQLFYVLLDGHPQNSSRREGGAGSEDGLAIKFSIAMMGMCMIRSEG